MTRSAYIIIRPRDPAAPLHGKNCEILVDGKELQYVSKVRFGIEVGQLATLSIDFAAPPAEIRGIFAVAEKPPKEEFGHNSHHTQCSWSGCPGDCFERYK